LESDIAFAEGYQLLGTAQDGTTQHTLAMVGLYATWSWYGSKTYMGAIVGIDKTSAQIEADPDTVLAGIPHNKVVAPSDLATKKYYFAWNDTDGWYSRQAADSGSTNGVIVAEQIEIGSASEHLNLNTDNDPNYGERITYDTPSGKKQIATTEDVGVPIDIGYAGYNADFVDVSVQAIGDYVYVSAGSITFTTPQAANTQIYMMEYGTDNWCGLVPHTVPCTYGTPGGDLHAGFITIKKSEYGWLFTTGNAPVAVGDLLYINFFYKYK
jgi:hypothetical protein